MVRAILAESAALRSPPPPLSISSGEAALAVRLETALD